MADGRMELNPDDLVQESHWMAATLKQQHYGARRLSNARLKIESSLTVSNPTDQCRLEILAISFSPTLPVSFRISLKAVGPLYLVSMPGEVKYPTHGVHVTCHGLHILPGQ